MIGCTLHYVLHCIYTSVQEKTLSQKFLDSNFGLGYKTNVQILIAYVFYSCCRDFSRR